jgi:3-oxoacyl-[acyl-carrier protein] reductase
MNEERPVALITGSGTGVGRACAVALAERGFDIVINYSRSQAEAEETQRLVGVQGAQSLLIQCDVSQEASVVSMIDAVRQKFERLDVLVNNAAMTYFIDGQDLASLTEDKWDRILAVNLKGPFFCVKAAADLLRSSPRGAVVNVSSVAGSTGKGSSIAYAASKGALNTLTKSLALSLAPVRVNAVLPGPIDSRWIREGNNDWNLDAMTANLPIPKASQPSDIAAAVVFLATGTSMATGQLLTIDGGLTL